MAVAVVASMPGTVAEVLVDIGDAVSAGEELIIIEAMKMENPIKAPASGVVKAIKVEVRDKVVVNQELLLIE